VIAFREKELDIAADYGLTVISGTVGIYLLSRIEETNP